MEFIQTSIHWLEFGRVTAGFMEKKMKNRRALVWRSSQFIAICIIILMMPPPSMAATADTPSQTAKREGDVAARAHDIVEGPHVEGHIAFLHAELGIIDEQEPLWAPVAAAMRQDVQNLEEAQRKVDSRTHGRLDAIQYLRNRVFFAQLRAQGEERFLKTLEPLYNVMSSNQKRMADELLIPRSPEDNQ
jgi:protein CpxP